MKIYYFIFDLCFCSQPEVWPEIGKNGNFEYFATLTDTGEKTRRKRRNFEDFLHFAFFEISVFSVKI